MRYYSLSLSSSTGSTVGLPSWGSYPGGTYDPGALNILFDLFVAPAGVPFGASTIRVEGVDPAILTNARTFTGMTATLLGGMMPGLPLATAANNGQLVKGQIYQSYANWVGTQVDLAFVLLGSPYTQAQPGNIVLNWKAGTQLSAALQSTLQTAFPNDKISMNISPNLVLSHDEVHAAYTLDGLGALLADITPTQVQIVKNGDTIRVIDTTFKPGPKTLDFVDFIGQPAWIEPNMIQTKLTLRGDLQVGDIIQMPSQYSSGAPGFVTTFASSLPSQLNYKSAIQGQFVIQSIRHVGDLRQPRGEAWVTVVNAASTGAQSQ